MMKIQATVTAEAVVAGYANGERGEYARLIHYIATDAENWSGEARQRMIQLLGVSRTFEPSGDCLRRLGELLIEASK